MQNQLSASNHVKDVIGAIIGKISETDKVSKPKSKFLGLYLSFLLSLHVRKTVSHMSRWSGMESKSIRLQMESGYDFLLFNLELLKKAEVKKSYLVFDPSFIPKSGKQTWGRGKYWCGTYQQALWGLEIGVLGAIDIERRQAYALESIQTPSRADLTKHDHTLMSHYAQILIDRKDSLLSVSKTLLVDTYFASDTFITPLTQVGFEMITKLKKNAYLRYLYKGEQKKGKGRPVQFDGKINLKDLSKLKEGYFDKWENEDNTYYSAIVNARALNRNIRLVIEVDKKNRQIYLVCLY